MRKSLRAGLGTAALLGSVLAPAAASAATHGPSGRPAGRPATGSDPDTSLTFTVASGGLTLTAPASAKFGVAAPGGSVSGRLGAVTVTDGRGLATATWTATVSSTDFSTGSGGGAATTPAADLFYDPGPVSTTGTITATSNGAVLSATPQAIVAGTSGSGINSAAWNPTVVVTVPSTAVAGTYTGTITESVS